MNSFCVIFLAFVSVYSKVIVKDNDITDAITSNDLHVDSKILITDKDDPNEISKIDAHATTDSVKTCDGSDDLDNDIDSNDNKPCANEDKIDVGTPLLLTPYLEEGRLEEGRQASKTDPKLFLGFESYSGFFTVDERYNSNIFFWYFPAVKPANDTPWIIWLQGGPGASSLTGLFDEIGPFHVQSDGSLAPNPFTWLQNHSLVFIDSPVGTGFSFTEHEDGYAMDMATYGRHLYSATKQLVQLFPELRTAPLYVAGESYGGKYVPALGMEIHRHKDTPGGDINLKGLMIGNAYIEPKMVTQIVRPFYHFGLVEKEQIESITPLIEAFQADIAANRSVQAKEKWNSLIMVFLHLTHQHHAYNFLQDDMLVGFYVRFLNKTDIRRALHVGQSKFSFINSTVNIKLAGDFLSSAKPLFEELLEHYRVLAYCGQLDQVLPCAYSSEIYRTWKWSKTKEFIDAPRLPYVNGKRLAGYTKSGGGLTWAVLRGAGHMAAMDAPLATQQLAQRWIHNRPLPNIPITQINIKLNKTTPYIYYYIYLIYNLMINVYFLVVVLFFNGFLPALDRLAAGLCPAATA